MTVETRFSAIECSRCGLRFGLPARYEDNRREDHREFWCPNGHSQYYPGETEAEKLRRELDTAKHNLAAWRESYAREAKSHSATKGQVTRLKNRVHAGVCIECHRHFANVERHMASKHPTETAV